MTVTSAPTVIVAPYAVVRTTALSLPESSAAAGEFRDRMERMLRLTTWSARVSAELSDALYEAVASAPPELRAVLLPLRRDVHNQRTPRLNQPALVAGVAERIPMLRRWLDTRAEIDKLAIELDQLSEAALRADRAALAQVCRSEALRRAVALTSQDLLRAVQRAAAVGDQPDKRARKSEATVLRYVLRAATKTNPLSWFTRVSWGWWRDGTGSPDGGRAATDSPVVAVARADRAALTSLVHAVLNRPDLRNELPHQLAPGLHIEGGQVFFHRPVAANDMPDGLVREEEVGLPLTKPLQHVLAVVRADGPVPPRVLTAAIADRLPGPRQVAVRAAEPYVRKLIDQKLLIPTYPVDPQATEALAAVAHWLDRLGLVEAAALLREIDARTAAFAQTPAADRPAALARITSLWDEAFTAVGTTPTKRRTPVTEDITCPVPLLLDARHGREALPDLARLAPLLEIFDQHAVVRRLARDRFVARFGLGGTCHSLAVFAAEYGEIWRDLKCFEVDGILNMEGGVTFSPELQELARLRRELVKAVAADESDDELILPEQVVHDAERLLPAWLRQRPTSYSVFAQPVPDETGRTRLCLNHIYGGWGRFTSRFLGYFGPAAAEAVAAQIRGGLGRDSRVAQIRPVSGFNGNLHPLLVDEEIAADGAGGKLLAEDLELVHDIDTDQLRLRVSATGEFLDVLYLGFLVAIVLPQRLSSLLHDHGSGLVDLTGALVRRQDRDTAFGTVSYRPRLRYRDLILSRAQWRLGPETVQAWRADLDREAGVPAQTAVRWRQELNLPQRLFVSAAPSGDAKGLEGFLSYFEQAKSQYVDLGSALHLRTLSRTLARYPHGVVLEEALPEPQPGTPAVEVVTEIYRSAP